MQTSIRGELTEEEKPVVSLRERAFVASVAQFIASSRDIREVEKALYPVLLCAAAGSNDIDAMLRMVEDGADVNTSDYDQRTPLHIAAASDHSLVVQFLLTHGADKEKIDRWGRTPLEEAIRSESWKAAQILKGE